MIGEVLKKLREEKGVTQDQMANFLCVKRQTYGAYERNVSVPDAITLKRLAEYFNVSADFLLEKSDGGKNTKKSTSSSDELEILKERFIKHGIIKEGEDLTDEQLEDYMKKLSTILKAFND